MKVHEALNLYKLHSNPEQLKGHDHASQYLNAELRWISLGQQMTWEGLEGNDENEDEDYDPHSHAGDMDPVYNLEVDGGTGKLEEIKDLYHISGAYPYNQATLKKLMADFDSEVSDYEVKETYKEFFAALRTMKQPCTLCKIEADDFQGVMVIEIPPNIGMQF